MSIYSKFKEAADHVVTWAALFGLLSAALAWLSSKLTLMKGFGIADFVFVGLITAAFITLVLAAILAAWRYFHPLFVSESTTGLDGHVERLVGVSPISTPQLASDLRDEIQGLEKKIFDRMNALEERALIDPSLGANVSEAFRNLDTAVHTKINRITEETQHFSGRIQWFDKDIHSLIFFATDLSTLAVLEGQIAEGEIIGIPLGPDIDLNDRNVHYYQVLNYFQNVRSVYGNTHRGSSIASVLQNAEAEAELTLRAMSVAERPTYIDLLDYRRLKIAETCRVRLLAFLLLQRDEKQAEIRRQRPHLVERLLSRDKG